MILISLRTQHTNNFINKCLILYGFIHEFWYFFVQKVKMCYINGYNSTYFYTITHDINKIYYHWAQT